MFQKTKKESTASAPPDLTAAISRASNILDQRSRNRAAAQETERQLKEAENLLATRRRGLAEAEANTAAGDGQQSANVKAATSYREVRDQIEILQIRREGIDAAFNELNRQLVDVEPEIVAARHAIFKAETTAFEREYVQAATVFAATLQKASALEAGLDFRFSNLRDFKLPGTLYEGTTVLYDNGVYPRHNGLVSVNVDWKSDPTATAIYERLYPHLELSNKINREINVVKRQVEEAEILAARQRQDDHFKNGRQTIALTVNEHRDLDQEQADASARSFNEKWEHRNDDCRAPDTKTQEAA